MTQEEKQLLLRDLCGRFPYGVKVKYVFDDGSYCPFELTTKILQECIDKQFIPYLRPMSSMTKEEKKELSKFGTNDKWDEDGVTIETEGTTSVLLYYHCLYIPLDWLNSHHFDYRGLIEKGLALEAPEGMYKQ